MGREGAAHRKHDVEAQTEVQKERQKLEVLLYKVVGSRDRCDRY
jgi:hypothetical protein